MHWRCDQVDLFSARGNRIRPPHRTSTWDGAPTAATRQWAQMYVSLQRVFASFAHSGNRCPRCEIRWTFSALGQRKSSTSSLSRRSESARARRPPVQGGGHSTPTQSRKDAAPEAVTTSTRGRALRATQPAVRNPASKERPCAPATCGRRSVQSIQLRTTSPAGRATPSEASSRRPVSRSRKPLSPEGSIQRRAANASVTATPSRPARWS